MSAASTLKRGGPAKQTGRRTSASKARRRPWLVTLFAALPISASGWQRIVTGLILTFGVGAVVAIALLLGLPTFLATQIARAADSAGFTVKRVEVAGIDRMDRLTVYAVALQGPSRAMPMIDLDAIRDRLLEYGWIAEARVSRRLPDTLVVDITERKPTAVWQHEQQLSLIDERGVILEPVGLNAMPDLPLIIGPDANIQATALTELLATAPQLKPMLAGATWVGNRRWDLRFQSGETLALPEGDGPAGTALRKFAAMDTSQRLLGRGFLRFDMRDPEKMFVRMTKEMPRIDKPVDPAVLTVATAGVA